MRNGPYILQIAPSNYPGKKYRNRYVYEHHLVWWLETGNIIPQGCVVHHKNGLKTDNRFENLELMEKNLHSQHHTKQPRRMYSFNCFWCHKPWQIPLRNYNSKTKAGQIRFYCSIKCASRYQFRGISIGRRQNC